MKTAAETRDIFDRLEAQHPDADTELDFSNAVRAARRDDSVGAVDRQAREPGHAGALQEVSRRDGARRGEAGGPRAAHSFDRLLPREGEVAHRHGEGAASPSTAARCRPTSTRSSTLPGVGRKTANVVLGHALGVPGLPVDRHVLRVANRIGIAESDDPEVVEQQLCARAAAGAVDARLRHADPARPAHLQAEAGLRPVRRAGRLPLLPVGRRRSDAPSRRRRPRRRAARPVRSARR